MRRADDVEIQELQQAAAVPVAAQAQPVPPALVVMHWLTAGLVLVAITAIVTRGLLPSGHAWRPLLRTTHVWVGQVLLLTIFARLALRARLGMPPSAGGPRWMATLGHLAHRVLYAALVLQPLTGIGFMQAGDKTVGLFGWALPQLVPSDKGLHFALKNVHETIGFVLYVLIAAHVAAALLHHFGWKNDTLRRMVRLRPTTR